MWRKMEHLDGDSEEPFEPATEGRGEITDLVSPN